MIFPVLAAVALSAGQAASPALSVDDCQLGQVAPFATAECVVTVSNNSDHVVRFTQVKSLSHAVLSVKTADLKVPAHSKSTLQIDINVGNAMGGFSYLLEASTDQPEHPTVRIVAHGFALSPVDQRKPKVDLGVVRQGSAASADIKFSSATDPDFSLGKVLEAPDWLKVSVSADKHALHFHVKPKPPLGLQNGFVKVAMDMPGQNQVWVWVDANIQGDVVPSSNPFNMGLIRRGNDNEFLIRLNSQSGKSFRIGKLALQDVAGTLEQEPCIPAAQGCRMIRLTLSDKQPLGTVKGKLWIDLPDSHEQLPVSLWGMFLDKDTKVGEIGDKSQDSAKTSVAPASEAPVDFSKALAGLSKAKAQHVDTPLPGKGPLLRWTIENGKSVYGFQVFRSTTESGTYQLLTPNPIPASQDTNDPVSYQWRDTSAESGKVYWYYIRSVNMDGGKTDLIKPQEVIAK